jgi:hypothetical protein
MFNRKKIPWSDLTAALTFEEDGLHAVMTIERKQP